MADKSDPFGLGDLFDGVFGKEKKSAPKKPEKGMAWRAKTIDGQYYVPLEQVAELLRLNDVLPNVCKGIERRVEEKKHG